MEEPWAKSLYAFRAYNLLPIISHERGNKTESETFCVMIQQTALRTHFKTLPELELHLSLSVVTCHAFFGREVWVVTLSAVKYVF
jgi:hypothetical protein